MEKALPVIPAKRYFTIGEVSELCGVKPYVLRYWEQEFTQLKPMKRRGNRRYYQHHEVLLIRRIRELLYDQGFTISGARNRLADSGLTLRGAQLAATPALPTPALHEPCDSGDENDDLGEAAALATGDLAGQRMGPEATVEGTGIEGTGIEDKPAHQTADTRPPQTSADAGSETALKRERALLRAELLSIRELLTV